MILAFGVLFLKMIFTLQEKEIFTSLSAARSLLEQKQHRPLLLVEDSALEDFTGTERDHDSIIIFVLATSKQC